MSDSNRSGSMSNQSSSTPLPSPSTLLQNSNINNIHQSINGRSNNYNERQQPSQQQSYVVQQGHSSNYTNSNVQSRPTQRIVTSHGNSTTNSHHHQTVVIQQRNPQPGHPQNSPYLRTQPLQSRVVGQPHPQQEVQASQNGDEPFGNVVVSQFRGSSMGNYTVQHKPTAPKPHIPQQAMQIIEPTKNGPIIDPEVQPLSAKEQYRELKRNFKFLVYENECYQDELRSLQRKLLKLSRDKNFLLDRLTQYEKLSDSSDDSDTSVKTIEDKSSKVKTKKRVRSTAAAKKKTSVTGPSLSVSQETSNNKTPISESTPTTPSVKTSPLKAKVEVAPLSSQALLKSASISQQRHPKSAPPQQSNVVSHHHDGGSHVMMDSSPLTSPNGKIIQNDMMISPNSSEYIIVNSIPDQHMEDRIIYEDIHHGQILEYVENDQYDNGETYYIENHSNL
uniref:INO80 complex subunit E (inferred by orthology to a human protein) n=1 Tax=Strongyloides venezuelensis TaxID=75913 RepID=A0A0K0FDS1_STRVS